MFRETLHYRKFLFPKQGGMLHRLRGMDAHGPMVAADPTVIMVRLHVYTSVVNSSLCSPQWICIYMSIEF